MQISGFESTQVLLEELGERIRDVRVARNMTQSELAASAGISTKTVSNIETGHDVSLQSLLQVLRSLDLLQNLNLLVPEQGPRPRDLEALGAKRKRARKKPQQARVASQWVWGEDE